jgi:hypothetical protein
MWDDCSYDFETMALIGNSNIARLRVSNSHVVTTRGGECDVRLTHVGFYNAIRLTHGAA